MAQISSMDLAADSLLQDGRAPGLSTVLHWPIGGWLSIIGWQYILPLVATNALGCGLLPSMNLLIAIQLLAAALATFTLLRRLGVGHWPAAAVAVYYGYHPFVFHLLYNGQFSEVAHWGLPALALLMLGGAAWKPGWRTIALGLLFGLLTASSPYSAITGAILCALVGCWALARSEGAQRRSTVRSLALAAGAVALGALPFILYYGIFSQGHDLLFKPNDLATVGDPRTQDLPGIASLVGWFVPFRFFKGHWEATGGAPMVHGGIRTTTMALDHTIGLTALVLAGVGWRRWHAGGITTSTIPLPGRRFWLICAATFLGVSSGYYLMLYPTAHIHMPSSALPLPLLAVLEAVPSAKAFAAPYRAAPGVLLAVAVLAGFGLERLTESLKGWKRAALVAGAILAITAEGAWADITPHPLVMTPFEMPQVYRDLAKHDDGEGLLTIPFWAHPTIPNQQIHQLWQRYHGHPLHMSDQGIIEQRHLTRFTHDLQVAMGCEVPSAPTVPSDGAPARWIVVHGAAVMPHQRSALDRILRDHADLIRLYDHDGTELWEVRTDAMMRY